MTWIGFCTQRASLGSEWLPSPQPLLPALLGVDSEALPSQPGGSISRVSRVVSVTSSLWDMPGTPGRRPASIPEPPRLDEEGGAASPED